jgi:hypothetical protein
VPVADPVAAVQAAVPDDATALLVGAADALLGPSDAVSALVAATDVPDGLLQATAPAAPVEAARSEASAPTPAPTDAKGAADGELRWPCSGCDEQVPMSLDICPTCGSSFLSGASGPPSMEIPMVGDISRMSRTQRLVFGVVVAFIVMIGLVVVGAILGHII